MPVAKFFAKPPDDMAVLAMFEACENLSQREKATVLVIVSTSAIATSC